MLATSKAAAKPKIVLLGHKDPAERIELDPEEGPAESEIAVAQDMWGEGNLSPLDNVFASTAIGALAVTGKAIFGAVCHHLGHRLFCFSREIDIWLDAYECEPALSLIQKRPKDKIKLGAWNANENKLGKDRYTKLAVLGMSKASVPLASLFDDCASSLKRKGNLFVADLVAGNGRAAPLARYGDLESLADHRSALSNAGFALCNEVDLTADVEGAIRRGFHNSLNALANIRALKEPWRSQRLAAYCRQIEIMGNLYRDLECGCVSAAGILALKP